MPRLCRLRANLHFTLWMCSADDSSNVHADTSHRQPQQAARVTSPLNIRVSCIVLRTVSISMTLVRETLQLQLMALCHSEVTLMKSEDINITETTYSCQFQYEFGNQ